MAVGPTRAELGADWHRGIAEPAVIEAHPRSARRDVRRNAERSDEPRSVGAAVPVALAQPPEPALNRLGRLASPRPFGERERHARRRSVHLDEPGDVLAPGEPGGGVSGILSGRWAHPRVMLGPVMPRPRPRTVIGLALAATLLLLARDPRRRRLASALGVVLVRGDHRVGRLRAPRARLGRAPLRDLQHRNYPKSPGQEEGALGAIRALDAGAVGLQEIAHPAGFARAASARLGARWKTVFSDHPAQRVGVLYDGAALTLVGSAMHRRTEIYDGAKPALEARLRRSDGIVTRMFVVASRRAVTAARSGEPSSTPSRR